MALHHAQPGEVVALSPLGKTLAEHPTTTLIKTDALEVIRLVLPAGKSIPAHSVPGEITVQCLKGRVKFPAMGKDIQLQAGEMLYLEGNESHAVQAIEDSTVLVTILLARKV